MFSFKKPLFYVMFYNFTAILHKICWNFHVFLSRNNPFMLFSAVSLPHHDVPSQPTYIQPERWLETWWTWAQICSMKFHGELWAVYSESVFALEFHDYDQKWIPGHRFMYLVIGHWHKISVINSKFNDLLFFNWVITQNCPDPCRTLGWTVTGNSKCIVILCFECGRAPAANTFNQA